MSNAESQAEPHRISRWVGLSALVLLITTGCGSWRLAGSKPVANRIRIVYTGDFDWTELPQLASLIEAEQPVLAVVAGRILEGGQITERFRGEAEIATLARTGVNAVCLTPDFLQLGREACRRLIDSVAPGVFFLSANVSAGSRPFGQAFIIAQNPDGQFPVRIAVLGVLADTGNVRIGESGLTWVEPAVAVRRFLGQMRMNADFAGVVTYPLEAAEISGLDFAIGQRADRNTAYRLTLEFDPENQLVKQRTERLNLRAAAPDSGVAELVRRYQQELPAGPEKGKK